MGQTSNDAGRNRGEGFGNTHEIAEIILASHCVEQAVDLFRRKVLCDNLVLLFLGEYDSSFAEDSVVIHSEFPPGLSDMCARFDKKKGCPLVQLAIKGRRPFEALNFYLSGFDDFFSMRYLKELQNLGYENIAVVPVELDRKILIFFFGLDSSGVRDGLLDRLHRICAQFVTGLAVKYRIGRPEFERDRKALALSEREVLCLKWMADGKNIFEISRILDISEVAVGLVIDSACSKMHASTRAQAVVFAIRMGLIDQDYQRTGQDDAEEPSVAAI